MAVLTGKFARVMRHIWRIAQVFLPVTGSTTPLLSSCASQAASQLT